MSSTILVIDDDPQVRTLVSRTLQSQGYTVQTASDGLEGLRVIDEVHPMLIIVDVDMPHVDGYRLAKAVKGKRDTAQIPVIFLTGMAEPRSVIEGINAGAKFYMTKPVQLEELLDKVRRALKRT